MKFVKGQRAAGGGTHISELMPLEPTAIKSVLNSVRGGCRWEGMDWATSSMNRGWKLTEDLKQRYAFNSRPTPEYLEEHGGEHVVATKKPSK